MTFNLMAWFSAEREGRCHEITYPPIYRYFRSWGSIYWSPRTALGGDRIPRDTGQETPRQTTTDFAIFDAATICVRDLYSGFSHCHCSEAQSQYLRVTSARPLGVLVLGQNGSGQNGTDKMVWTKWHTDKMALDKMIWTKWHG